MAVLLRPSLSVQGRGILYDLAVPANYSMPDLLLTINSTTSGTGLGLYCGRRGTQASSGSYLWASGTCSIRFEHRNTARLGRLSFPFFCCEKSSSVQSMQQCITVQSFMYQGLRLA